VARIAAAEELSPNMSAPLVDLLGEIESLTGNRGARCPGMVISGLDNTARAA
jgi:hypothetical protein